MAALTYFFFFAVLVFASLLATTTSQLIPGQYIVVLNDNADLHDHLKGVNKTLGHGDQILHIYDTPKGYAGRFSDKVLNRIKSHKSTKYVEQDQISSSSQVTYQTQTNVETWGLGRISLNANLTNGVPKTYQYATQAGAGVIVYIIDTGITPTHSEYVGRATSGFTSKPNGDTNPNDCHGHGTHVASTAVGTQYGVAKLATVVGVKVLNCSGNGPNSGIIAGVNWVKSRSVPGKCVTNMSLGGPRAPALNEAVAGLINSGCIVVISAGNKNADCCTTSPAMVPSAITVGAHAIADKRADYSNYGPCVDVFGPGTGIKGAGRKTNTATAVYTGTSMAAPHVAGVCAVQLSRGYTNAQVYSIVADQSTRGALKLNCTTTTTCLQSPNKIIFSPYR